MINTVFLLGSLLILLGWLRAIEGPVRLSPQGRKADNRSPDDYRNQ